jgi:hypothetical protein
VAHEVALLELRQQRDLLAQRDAAGLCPDARVGEGQDAVAEVDELGGVVQVGGPSDISTDVVNGSSRWTLATTASTARGPHAATFLSPGVCSGRPVAVSKPVELDDGLAVLLESVGDPRLPNAVQNPDGPLELVEGSVGGLSISLDLLLSVRVPGVRGAHSSPFG